MRRNTAKVLRQARSPKRLALTPVRASAKAPASAPSLPPTPPVPAEAPVAASSVTLGELIAAAYDVVGDDPHRIAELLASPELRRRIHRAIFVV